MRVKFAGIALAGFVSIAGTCSDIADTKKQTQQTNMLEIASPAILYCRCRRLRIQALLDTGNKSMTLSRYEARKQEERVINILADWAHRLGFGQWQRLDVVYKNEVKEGDDENIKTTAEAHADWSRMWGEITVYLPSITGLSDKELEHALLHEMAHIILSGMSLAAIAQNPGLSTWLDEWTATRLAQIFVWIREDLRTEEQNPCL